MARMARRKRIGFFFFVFPPCSKMPGTYIYMYRHYSSTIFVWHFFTFLEKFGPHGHLFNIFISLNAFVYSRTEYQLRGYFLKIQ